MVAAQIVALEFLLGPGRRRPAGPALPKYPPRASPLLGGSVSRRALELRDRPLLFPQCRTSL